MRAERDDSPCPAAHGRAVVTVRLTLLLLIVGARPPYFRRTVTRMTFAVGHRRHNSYWAHLQASRLENRVSGLVNGFKNKKEKTERLGNVAW